MQVKIKKKVHRIHMSRHRETVLVLKQLDLIDSLATTLIRNNFMTPG